MYSGIYRAMLGHMKKSRGCDLGELAAALPREYTDGVDATPEWLAHDSAVKLVEWGLAEAFIGDKPIPLEEFRRFRRWQMPEDVKLFISKVTLEIEDLFDLNLSNLPSSVLRDHRRIRWRRWPQVFIIMPFAKKMTPVYEKHIKPTVESLKLTVARGDNFFSSDHIMAEVWAAINYSEIVVADCTDRNANVFYELGLCHALGKDAVLITQDVEDVPFDLRHLRFIKYNTTEAGLKDLSIALAKAINEIRQNAR